MLRNAALAQELEEIGDLLELQDANAFRVRAWRNAARTVADLERPVAAMVEAGEDLTDLPGVGKDIAAQLEARVGGASMPALLEAREAVPSGLLDVVRVPGVGPKKARALWRELGVESLDALEAAARDGRIEALKGFGAKTQTRIEQGVAQVRRFQARRRRADAEADVEDLLATLRAVPGVERCEVAGSYRRGRDTVGDVDLLVVAEDPNGAMAALRGYGAVERVIGSGEAKTSVLLRDGLQVDLRVVDDAAFGAAWLYFTGSKAHNVRLRSRAQARDASLNEYGLWSADEAQRLAGAEEADVYAALGLAFVPPELREDRGEIERAERGTLPDLVEVGDVRAELHAHTDWSDGQADLEAMMRAAAERGREVLAITDHGPTLRMTGGLDRAKLLRQMEAIDAVRDAVPGLTVLRGVEVDVLEDGALDLDDDVLATLDVVVASVHTHLELDAAAQTDRILRAVRHPAVNVLGHPTGRLIGKREGMAFDLHAVVEGAAAHDVALEINAHPARLDLGDVAARAAAAAGARIAVNTDAHAPSDLDLLRHGILQARRAGLEADAVINTWSTARLRAFLAKEDAEPGAG
ncbi:MAG: DNA polymerase/3'-5' exonuclease PolX [Trueperaceae bacterium]|nr:DNA polymerase/3'-5' exonuclease PolX [Trueperaceae bacterium]